MSKSMLIKILTGVALIAAVVPCFYFGGYFLQGLALAFAFLAAYETAGLFRFINRWFLTGILFVVMAAVFYLPTKYFLVITSIFIVILFVIELLGKTESSQFVSFTFLIVMMVGLALDCLNLIYKNGGKQGFPIVLYVALACYVCDTMAYFTGVFFGKHKMIPHISPNKTWEGAAGGYFFALLVSMIYGLSYTELPRGLVIAGSCILPACAQIGDLAFSGIKRHFKIKDFGSVFPGHGGALDRIDSLIFCLMVFHALMIVWGLNG